MNTAPAASRRPARLLAACGGDRGSATGWAIGIMVIGLLLAGLVFDGGNAMATKVRALDIAQQAARAGADQIDLTVLRGSGALQLDPAAAQTAAHQFLTQAGVSGTVTATTDQVSVTVTLTEPAVLLAVIGVSTYTLTASGTAEPRPT
jgi:Flp pilus assembly protein TadG